MICFPIFGPPWPFRPTRGPNFMLSSYFFIFISYVFRILGPKSNSSLLNTKDLTKHDVALTWHSMASSNNFGQHGACMQEHWTTSNAHHCSRYVLSPASDFRAGQGVCYQTQSPHWNVKVKTNITCNLFTRGRPYEVHQKDPTNQMEAHIAVCLCRSHCRTVLLWQMFHAQAWQRSW